MTIRDIISDRVSIEAARLYKAGDVGVSGSEAYILAKSAVLEEITTILERNPLGAEIIQRGLMVNYISELVEEKQ